MAKKEIVFLIMFLILFSQISFALSDKSVEVETALNLAQKNITEMMKNNFTVLRVNDTYTLAKEDYDSKIILEQKGRSIDYTIVLSRVDEIFSARNDAFLVHDEIIALEMVLEQLQDKNLTETFAVYDEVVQEFKDERYEESLNAIDRCYDKMSEEQAAKATVAAFYDSTSKTIRNFLIDNWQYILITLITLSIIIAVVYKTISTYLIHVKMKRLELEKQILKKLIAESQREYFEKGKMSESEYHIKIKKFGELIRNIDRQVPVLKEDLVKLGKMKILLSKSKLKREEMKFEKTMRKEKKKSKIDIKKLLGIDKIDFSVKKSEPKKIIEKPEANKPKKIFKFSEKKQLIKKKILEKKDKVKKKVKTNFDVLLVKYKKWNSEKKRQKIIEAKKREKILEERKRKIEQTRRQKTLEKNKHEQQRRSVIKKIEVAKLRKKRQKKLLIRKREMDRQNRINEIKKKKIQEMRRRDLLKRKQILERNRLAKIRYMKIMRARQKRKAKIKKFEKDFSNAITLKKFRQKFKNKINNYNRKQKQKRDKIEQIRRKKILERQRQIDAIRRNKILQKKKIEQTRLAKIRKAKQITENIRRQKEFMIKKKQIEKNKRMQESKRKREAVLRKRVLEKRKAAQKRKRQINKMKKSFSNMFKIKKKSKKKLK